MSYAPTSAAAPASAAGSAEPMVADAREVLRRRFGFDQFRPGQEAVIGHLLGGRSAAAVFPTGAGKSLCYQLPSVMLPGVTLVVSPLIALMKDQIDALAGRGIEARRLDSTLSADEYRETIDAAQSGELRLLYVAPERFNNERFRETIGRLRVSLFAVDEAHCISEWGHNFRPDYLKLAHFARQWKAERILALTATATPRVLEDIRRGFEIDPQCAIRTGFHRPNLTLLTTPVTADERDAALLARLNQHAPGAATTGEQGPTTQREPGPTIIYVTLQKTAERVAARLSAEGFPARAYHAGMDTEQRTEVQEWFLQAGGADDATAAAAAPIVAAPIVVATIAFGMGIDKRDIRAVYHYNPPKSLENYAQEIGRAGRDDRPSVCEMFFCPDDLVTLENFAHGDTPTERAVAGLVEEVLAQADSGDADGWFELSLYELSGRHDIRLLVVRTLLCYLELDGYLEGGTPFFSSYRFQPLVSSSDILGHFEGERREFLAQVLRQVRRAKKWFHFDADAAAKTLGCPRDRIVRALDYLAQQGWIDLQTSGVRHRYRLLRRPEDVAELAHTLHQRTLEREAREIGRLGEVLDLVSHDGCQVSALGRHFGEPLDGSCGHCSWCLDGRRPRRLPERCSQAISEGVLADATSLARRVPGVFPEARPLARLLCGMSSPRTSREKLDGERLTRHRLFGALEDVPFSRVLQALEEKWVP